MKKENIFKDSCRLDALLERFYDAELSRTEELELVRLLSDPALPEKYFADRDVVTGLAGKACDSEAGCGDAFHAVPEGFEHRLESAVDKASRKSRFRLYFVRAALAAAVLAAGIIIGVRFSAKDETAMEDSLAEVSAEEAREAVEKAFNLLAYGIEKSREPIVAAERHFDKSGKAINDAIEKIKDMEK